MNEMTASIDIVVWTIGFVRARGVPQAMPSPANGRDDMVCLALTPWRVCATRSMKLRMRERERESGIKSCERM